MIFRCGFRFPKGTEPFPEACPGAVPPEVRFRRSAIPRIRGNASRTPANTAFSRRTRPRSGQVLSHRSAGRTAGPSSARRWRGRTRRPSARFVVGPQGTDKTPKQPRPSFGPPLRLAVGQRVLLCYAHVPMGWSCLAKSAPLRGRRMRGQSQLQAKDPPTESRF